MIVSKYSTINEDKKRYAKSWNWRDEGDWKKRWYVNRYWMTISMKTREIKRESVIRVTRRIGESGCVYVHLFVDLLRLNSVKISVHWKGWMGGEEEEGVDRDEADETSIFVLGHPRTRYLSRKSQKTKNCLEKTKNCLQNWGIHDVKSWFCHLDICRFVNNLFKLHVASLIVKAKRTSDERVRKLS